MVRPIMRTHGWGIWLDWHPLCPRYDYSLLKATSVSGIDGAICSTAKNSERSIRNPSSSTRSSAYEFRIWCSSDSGLINKDDDDNNPVIQDTTDKDGIEEIYYPETESCGSGMGNTNDNIQNSIILDAEKEGIEDVYYPESESYDDDGNGIQVHVEKIAKSRRRIQSRVSIQASLDTVWNILTDYDRLAEFIPSLAVSQLLEKRDNCARLLQIGQQNLAFGLKFKAKGIIDCYEKDIQNLPCGQRRDIEFKMIEGDFKLFEGKWSIEQSNAGKYNLSDSTVGWGFRTTLLYVVEVEPKIWLPVHLVQGRLCRDIKMNLSCIQNVAEKASQNTGSAY